MYWTRNGAIVDFISDNDARKLNWDEGHGTSVHTNRYDLTILPDDGRIKATDTYISENMGSWDGIGKEDADQHVTFNLRFSFGTKGGKVIYDGQEIKSLKDIYGIESEGPKPLTIQIVPDEGYVLKSVSRNGIDATHYVVDNVLSFSSLSYYTALSFSFEQVETTPPDEEEEEPQEPEEYVNYYDGTLTFYYDDQRSNREGKTFGLYDYKLISDGYKIPSWYDDSDKVTKAVFDASFANSKPNTTSCWFYDFKNLQEVEGIGNLNTSEVTDMSRMFYYCSSLASLDLSHFDTSNVTNMAEMFRYAGDPEFELDVSNFNTSNVTNMRHMFNACSAVSLDLSNFDTSNVTDMSQMFMGTSLTYLDLSSFDTHQVKDMIRMFDSGEFQEIVFSDQYVSSLSTLCDLAFWKDTEKLQTVTYTGDIPESIHSNFYLHVGTEDNPAFLNVPEEYKEHYKEKFDGQKFYGGYFTLGDENNPSHPVSHVSAYVVYKDGTLTFYYDNLRGRRKGTIYSIDQRKNGAPAWVENKESVTKAVFNKSFAKYTSLTSTREWFSGCEKLEAISGIENLKTDNVTDMNCMFANCSSLTSLDLSTFKTENVTNMGWMFLSCSNLNSLDISSFNTNNVTNMYCMFSYCSSLTKLDLSSFNSAKVTSMWGMFQNCKSLTSLDLSSFNTNEVTDMGEMFISCKKLSTIFANEKIWSTAKVEKSANMFTGCSKLVGGNGTKYDSNHTDVGYARIDKPNSPGYLSIKGDGNGDGKVDYVDVDMIANYILTHADGYNVKMDINKDGKVNAADIVALVNIIKTSPDTDSGSNPNTGSGYFWVGTVKPLNSNIATQEGVVTTYKSLDEALKTVPSIDIASGSFVVVLCPSSWNLSTDNVVIQDEESGKIYNLIKGKTDIADHDFFQTKEKIFNTTTVALKTKTATEALINTGTVKQVNSMVEASLTGCSRDDNGGILLTFTLKNVSGQDFGEVRVGHTGYYQNMEGSTDTGDEIHNLSVSIMSQTSGNWGDDVRFSFPANDTKSLMIGIDNVSATAKSLTLQVGVYCETWEVQNDVIKFVNIPIQ